jgi:cellulose synthase/poly-beta-1,6-N-acetylglucosamine synthase-like glycosyltransferase
MTWLFWCSGAIVAYVYLGYPLLLRLWSRIRPRGTPAAPACGDLPGVSIVIAARNEARVLENRIENLLALDYPPDRRQIIVVSDGSTDGTSAILARHRQSVDGIELPAGGKARALNAGVARARHDIIVFTDARQAFLPDALRELVAPLGDPNVGVVTGELVLAGELGDRRASGDRRGGVSEIDAERRAGREQPGPVSSTIAEGVGLYWQYEKGIRRDESAIHSTLGATGAIYAIRRSLWKPLPGDTILDDVLTPMRVVLGGYRSVFADRARAFDRPSPHAKAEWVRKVRTLAGNYQLLRLLPQLLLPWRNPVWFQFVSHKVGRLVVPYALLALLVSSVFLVGHSPFYAAAFAGQCLFYALAAYGAWLDSQGSAAISRPPAAAPRVLDRFARIALTFLVLNGSAVAGLGMFLLRRKVWG